MKALGRVLVAAFILAIAFAWPARAERESVCDLGGSSFDKSMDSFSKMDPGYGRTWLNVEKGTPYTVVWMIAENAPTALFMVFRDDCLLVKQSMFPLQVVRLFGLDIQKIFPAVTPEIQH